MKDPLDSPVLRGDPAQPIPHVTPYEWQDLTEAKEFNCGSLSVVVEFMELYDRFDGDEAKVFELLGKLRDLLA